MPSAPNEEGWGGVGTPCLGTSCCSQSTRCSIPYPFKRYHAAVLQDTYYKDLGVSADDQGLQQQPQNTDSKVQLMSSLPAVSGWAAASKYWYLMYVAAHAWQSVHSSGVCFCCCLLLSSVDFDLFLSRAASEATQQQAHACCALSVQGSLCMTATQVCTVLCFAGVLVTYGSQTGQCTAATACSCGGRCAGWCSSGRVHAATAVVSWRTA